MIPIINPTIEPCGEIRRPAADHVGVAVEGMPTKPHPIFLHREDSEPVRVALRSRLAPTQQFSSLRATRRRPTAVRVNRSANLNTGMQTVLPATFVASRCDFASRSYVFPENDMRWKQIGGLQTIGFRRTNGFDKNQRGVWEYLK
jgi:hypothetical protein